MWSLFIWTNMKLLMQFSLFIHSSSLWLLFIKNLSLWKRNFLKGTILLSKSIHPIFVFVHTWIFRCAILTPITVECQVPLQNCLVSVFVVLEVILVTPSTSTCLIIHLLLFNHTPLRSSLSSSTIIVFYLLISH